MSEMNAILPVSNLVWGPTERPKPGPGEVRIRVHATAVNRADLVQQAGAYPPPPGASQILGLEAAGTIDAIGPGVTTRRIGDRVAALLSGGGYAEYAVCPASHTLLVPSSTPLSTAGALVETLTTAFLNLKMEASLQPGERVLVHAGASGVGTFAIQLCKAWGNPVWVTVGSDAKGAICETLGADGFSNRHDGPWLPDVKAWSGSSGVDVILDPVGATYLDGNQRALARRGRLVLIGLMGGRSATVDLGRLLVHRQQILGSVLRSRSTEEKSSILTRVRREVWDWCFDGTLQPQIHQTMSLTDAASAHALVASNQTVGKVVLEVPGVRE